MKRSPKLAVCFATALVIFGCTKTKPAGAQQSQSGESMRISSSAFQKGGTIPAKYTCIGADMSPPLAWSGAPANTKSFVLMMSDPDAPGGAFFHWVVDDLSPNVTALGEDASAQRKLPGVAFFGENASAQRAPNVAFQEGNDFGKARYNGPCPPPGKPHHYHFVLYALDVVLDPRDYANHTIIEHAMRGHILAQAELVGTFGR